MEFIESKIDGIFNVSQVKEWASLFHGFGDNSLNFPFSSEQVDVSAWEKLSTNLKLLVLNQQHGKKIVNLSKAPTDEELAAMITTPPIADAWIVSGAVLREKGIVCGIRTADCFPVLVKSQTKDFLAAVHCGWRGAQTGLLLDVITQMARLGCPQKELEVAIGPGAQSGAYEIQEDVASKLEMAYEFVNFPTATDIPEPVIRREGKIFAALSNLLAAQAVFSGVLKKNILVHPDCTITNERYYSHRRQKEQAGRQLSIVGPNLS